MIMIYLQVYHVGICFIISHIAHTVKRPWVWKELYKSNVLLLLYIISCSVICPMVGLPHISYVIIYCRTMIQHITEISNDHVYVKKDKTAVKHFISYKSCNTLTLLCSVNSSLCGLSFLSALMVVFLAFFCSGGGLTASCSTQIQNYPVFTAVCSLLLLFCGY